MSQEQSLHITWETIIKIFIAVFIMYVIYLARDVFLWFLFGLIISILLEPAINFLRKIWIPRILAILLVYFSIFGVLGLLIYLTAPVFIVEVKQLSQYLPDYFNQISPVLKNIGIDLSRVFDDFTGNLIMNLGQSSKGIVNALVAFFGGLSSTIFILAIAFFISLEEKGAERFIAFVSPAKYQDRLVTFFEKAQYKVAGWFGARILACIFVGVASFLVFYIFSIKYALLLALISGILNFIPYIGPILTFVTLMIFILVSANSIYTLFYVIVAIMIIQAIENNILSPLLMKKIINLSPVLVLISLLVGIKMFGFLGALFAVPAAGIIYEFIKEIMEKRKEGALPE